MADDARTALFDEIERDLAGVEVALARLDAGAYFACVACGNDLGDVVVVDPTADHCASCAGAGAATQAADGTADGDAVD
jgi:RNA polymerase-binding transcription factor DksA